MIRRPPRSTRTDTLFPYTTLFRSGSGFIISSDGYIVTNAHVVSGGTATAVVDSITVILTNRKEYEAKLIGRDVASDLAVLKINSRGMPFVKFGDSNKTRVGNWELGRASCRARMETYRLDWV